MPHGRRHVAQRRENKSPLEQELVWDAQGALARVALDDAVAVQEQVKVDDARPVAHPARGASEITLDALECDEERGGREGGAQLARGVEKVGLLDHVLRCGDVELRDARHLAAARAQLAQRRRCVSCPIPEITPESDVRSREAAASEGT